MTLERSSTAGGARRATLRSPLMQSLVHRVKVFVYQHVEEEPEYLLLRRSQGIESFWSPLHGPIGFGEKIEGAIRREVSEDIGLGRPLELVDLDMPSRWILGDEQVIEWNYGFRVPNECDQLHLARSWSDFCWAGYSDAYPSLELEPDRAAITRLHTILHRN